MSCISNDLQSGILEVLRDDSKDWLHPPQRSKSFAWAVTDLRALHFLGISQGPFVFISAVLAQKMLSLPCFHSLRGTRCDF